MRLQVSRKKLDGNPSSDEVLCSRGRETSHEVHVHVSETEEFAADYSVSLLNIDIIHRRLLILQVFFHNGAQPTLEYLFNALIGITTTYSSSLATATHRLQQFGTFLLSHFISSLLHLICFEL